VSRIRLLVAYDGAPFRGFAPNRGVRTVAGDLAVAIERVVGCEVTLTCAGRTDAGVHAWGQVVTFEVDAPVDPVRLQQSINGLCAPSIVVREADEAPEGFDARFSASSRVYRYTILNRSTPDPFLHATSWHVAEPLELRSMRAASDPLIGEHDFSSFCRRREVTDPTTGERTDATLVRRVLRAEWAEPGDGRLRFEIEASSFCHQMVRSVVGMLVDVGRGRRTAADVTVALAARDRQAAGQIAPPHGLCLWRVHFGDDAANDDAGPASAPDVAALPPSALS
jgi:tRNA pseudouridine38-40 synthase